MTIKDGVKLRIFLKVEYTCETLSELKEAIDHIEETTDEMLEAADVTIVSSSLLGLKGGKVIALSTLPPRPSTAVVVAPAAPVAPEPDVIHLDAKEIGS